LPHFSVPFLFRCNTSLSICMHLTFRPDMGLVVVVRGSALRYDRDGIYHERYRHRIAARLGWLNTVAGG
jgi:hypothetical protein